MSDVSLDDFRAALTPGEIRILQLICAALALSTVMMLFVFIIVIQVNEGPDPVAADLSFIQIMTLVALLLTVSLLPLSGVVANRILRGGGPPATAHEAVGRIRTALILRAALLEGAALFGLVVFLLAGLRGVLQQEPIYWANLFPWILFVGFVALTFPTRDRLETLFRTRIQSR